jgi:hypothetical protein
MITNLTRNLYKPLSRKAHEIWAVLYPGGYAKYYHKKVFGKKLNLTNPKDFNEKIQWLKVYSDITEWVRLADKYLVRDYLKNLGLEDNLVKLYGCWENADEIDFDKLPDKFVLKTNHGFNNIILVPDKTQIDKEKIKKQLNNWIKEKHGLVCFQPHYWNIPPKIIAEEYLQEKASLKEISSSLIDYKFLCINGEPEIILIVYDRKHRTIKTNDEPSYKIFAVDLNWNFRNDIITDSVEEADYLKIPKPECLREMTEIARILAKPFPQVRVDLYEVNRKVYFGELTFTLGGGEKFTNEYLLKWGEKMDLLTAKLRMSRFII